MDVELQMDLEQRNREHVLIHWFHVTTDDLRQIAAGVVPDQVKACAQLGIDTFEGKWPTARPKAR